ncbi:MAG: OmpH family outer membrane protein [Gemmatimonadaceae bacterium]|nr:OmpH family outer membrane protein [Chitinophagaceae bacterium]
MIFSEKHPEKNNVKQTSGTAAASQNFSIAYFEMDSLENNFDYIKELMTNISDKERKLVGDLTSLQKKFQNRAGELQQRAQTMTQSEGEAANREIMDMDQRLKERKNQIDQELFEYKNSLLQDARNKIENYLKDYNKQKGYSYIFSYEPGFIYYRDSIYNITPDLVRGLNGLYKPKK